MKISFIGGGMMGEAIVKSLLAKGVAKPADITVSDVSQVRRDTLKKNYGIKAVANSKEAIKGLSLIHI